MRIKAVLSLSCTIALGLALPGCAPTPTPTPLPSPAQACVDFETPLAVGTQYGATASQAPGTLIFTTNGIPVSIYEFRHTTGAAKIVKRHRRPHVRRDVVGSAAFGLAKIVKPLAGFGQGQSMSTNNVNLEFDFSQLGFPTSQAQFEFLAMGGYQNIAVDGNPNPIFAGDLATAPNPIGGIGHAVITNPAAGGVQGTMTLTGKVKSLRVGGQEFWIDNVCVWK